ncbi:MAG: tetratricopeptide repeat protein [Gallionellaceae bacterium]|nr:tetratricopeptide repeat protein [Gallionellaceae bacterium]
MKQEIDGMGSTIIFRTLVAGFMALSFPILASADFKATPEEKKMCDVTIWSRMVQGDQNWSHVHHYCDCVRFTNRAYAALGKDKQAVSFNLGEAMGGCNYVISHTTPDFSLLPEIFLQKGVIYSLRGEDSLAAGEYLRAISGNNKLVKAYIGMADYFSQKNDKKKALEIITTGLQNNPESKGLKRMYKELGGAMPYPVPTAAVAEAPGKKPDDAAANAQPPNAAEPPQDKAGKQETPLAVADTPVEVRDEIGSPTNPWCRFCPDTPAAPPARSPSMPGVVPKAER